MLVVVRYAQLTVVVVGKVTYCARGRKILYFTPLGLDFLNVKKTNAANIIKCHKLIKMWKCTALRRLGHPQVGEGL